MTLDIHLLKKILCLIAGSFLYVTLIVLALFLVQLLMNIGTGFEIQIQRIKLNKIINSYFIIYFYGMLPSFVAIAFVEVQRLKKIKDYIISTVICVLILLIGLYTWVEIINPFLESATPPPDNHFSNISRNPQAPTPSTLQTLFSIGLRGIVISITHSCLYWFFIVRKHNSCD